MKNRTCSKLLSVMIIILCVLSILPGNLSMAVDANFLISVGEGSNKVTVTKTTTVNDIIKVLGQPKLKTPSAFGGYAYTFYTDNDYSNYLYIETTANDKDIISYGSIDPSYKTSTYSYGDAYNYRENGAFYGCLFNDSGKVHGGIYYNKTIVDFYDLVNTFKENFANNEIYRKGESQQGVTMYNALSAKKGYPANLVFDEEIYKYNQDLKKQGTSLQEVRQYVQSEYSYGIRLRENVEIQNSVYYLFNPLMYASQMSATTNQSLDDRNLAMFDYDVSKKQLFLTAVNNDFKNAVKSNKVADLMIDEVNLKVESNIMYALSLLDNKMSEVEKAQILAQYVQEGNVYSMADKWNGYKWMLTNHAGVCADFAETSKVILNRAGLLCEEVTSQKADHGWNICYLDGEWRYLDTTGNWDKITIDPYGFYGKTSFNKYNSMYQNFVDAKADVDIFDELPEGKDAETTYSNSKIYYDNTYKYYTQGAIANTQKGVFRESRTTGKKELLTANAVQSNMAKVGSKLYFLGNDDTVRSINIDGTNEKQEVKSTTSNERIDGIYAQDGFIWYVKYNTDTKKKEYIKYIEIKDYPTVGTYTLNDSKHKYSLKYVQNSKGVVITQCIGLGNNMPQGEIYIPNMINGKPVIGIGEGAFSGIGKYLTGTLVLPENLEYIAQRAFSSCENIDGIQFNDKLKSIGYAAFSRNKKVTNINLPDSLTYMDGRAFSGCESLTDVKIGKNINVISEYIFENCTSLRQIIFPSNVNRISKYALKGTTSLKNVIIESKEIERMEFDSKNADIYLYGNTTTSKYADDHNIKYKDLNTNKPSLEKPILSIDRDELQINSLTERPKITATLSDGGSPNVIWTSSNEKIATVSNGVITPKAGGFVYIEAYDANTKNLKQSCWVYVCVLRTLPDGSKVYPGDLDGDGVINANDTSSILDWFNRNLTEDEIAVADLDSNGVVNANDASISSDLFNSNSKFRPGKYNPVTKVTLNQTTLTLAKVGNTETITATFAPLDTTDSPNVRWYSDNTKVATVTNGKVTAIGSGTATIRATVGKKSATCTVTVPQPIIPLMGISLNKTTLTLEKGKSETLTVAYNPSNTTENKTVTWKSSDTKIVTVSNGKITAIGSGKATITAMVNGKNATCTVTVPKEQSGGTETKPEEPEKPTIDYLLGDVDGNGKIDAQDAVMILKYVAHNITLTDKQLLAANTTKDGTVDAQDAVQILKLVAHNISGF